MVSLIQSPEPDLSAGEFANLTRRLGAFELAVVLSKFRFGSEIVSSEVRGSGPAERPLSPRIFAARDADRPEL